MPLLFLLLSAVSAADAAAAAAPCAGAPATPAEAEAACPHLAEALRRWRGDVAAPVDAITRLCPEGASEDAWRSCRLRRDGLFAEEAEVAAAEGWTSAVLASRLYADLRAGGSAEADARRLARQVAGLDAAPFRPVRAALPASIPPDLPGLPARPYLQPCAPVVVIEADGRVLREGQVVSPDAVVEAGLWTVLPALRQPPPAGCEHAEIVASAQAPASALAPVAESLLRAGYRELYLVGIHADVAGDQDVLSPLAAARLRVAPGGDAPSDAVEVVLTTGWAGEGAGEADDLHLRWSREDAVAVAEVAAAIRASGSGKRAWIDTYREDLAPIQAAGTSLEGSMMMAGDPARRALESALDARVEESYACYRAALRRRPALAGRVEIDVSVAGTGQVHSARIRAATLLDDGMHSCMLEHLAATSALPATGRPAFFHYRLDFRAQ